MKIVQIEDCYIETLKKEFPSIMDSKRFHRSHTRKYLGILFSIGDFNYYAPFSSPKAHDYNADGSIKKSTITSIRLTKIDKEIKILLGSIKLNNMIPVPMKYVSGYSMENEADKKYVELINDELKKISEIQNLIVKSAKRLYGIKANEAKNINESNKTFYQSILNFKEIENYLIGNKLI